MKRSNILVFLFFLFNFLQSLSFGAQASWTDDSATWTPENIINVIFYSLQPDAKQTRVIISAEATIDHLRDKGFPDKSNSWALTNSWAEANIDVNQRINDHGDTLLIWAVRECAGKFAFGNSRDCAYDLMLRGWPSLDVNIQDATGATALHYAARLAGENKTTKVERYDQQGIFDDYRYYKGISAENLRLFRDVDGSRSESKFKENLTIKDIQGRTVLDYAYLRPDSDPEKQAVIQFLIKNGAKLGNGAIPDVQHQTNGSGKSNYTALMAIPATGLILAAGVGGLVALNYKKNKQKSKKQQKTDVNTQPKKVLEN